MSRRALTIGAVLVLAAAVASVAISVPLGGSGTASADTSDSAAETSLATVVRRTLSSQTLVSATIGYADASTIVLPGGTSPSALQQAHGEVGTAEGQLATAETTLETDGDVLEAARAKYTADRQKQLVDCRGAGAAEQQASAGSSEATGSCAADTQTVSADEDSVATAAAKVASDRRAASSAQTALAAARSSLAAAESSAAAFGQTSTYTALPDVGQIIARGETLYEIDGHPVVLLYGAATAWRPFRSGMSPGRDVAALNANLRALGFATDPGDSFTSQTASAIRAFQAAHGLPQTGELLLGSVAFEPGAVRVTSVTPTRGAAAQAGPVLEVTSTKRRVTIALDAAQQSSVEVGDPVEITLPDNRTTPGVVSHVGTVATTPSAENGQDQSPTIAVEVTPTHPAATGRLDQAPVTVAITTATVRNALVVPVNALLALAGGGYAVEVAAADGSRRLVGVEAGLFDDAEGLVQVSGDGLAQGQRVVVPAQ